MKMIADMTNGKLIFSGTCFAISNRVRTLRQGTRKRTEVVLTVPHGFPNKPMPYDPMPFPLGAWKITGIEWQKDRKFDYDTYGPVKIRTDAWQWAKIWELDKDGDYFRERGDEVKDGGYLLHYSVSTTTLGCIRIETPQAAETLARLVEKFLARGEDVDLEVI